MIKHTLVVLLLLLGSQAYAQEIINLDKLSIQTEQSLYSRQLYTDAQVSSFIMELKDEVREHYHRFHTEQVLVLSGKGEIKMGGKKWQNIQAGDLIIIPANTPHAVRVKGKKPMRVLSIQAPNFDGSDRVWVDEDNTPR
jgi:quercetin dioxygenase-like cupin family protein